MLLNPTVEIENNIAKIAISFLEYEVNILFRNLVIENSFPLQDARAHSFRCKCTYFRELAWRMVM